MPQDFDEHVIKVLVVVMAERSHLNTQLLTALGLAVAAIEDTQRRFRTAVLMRLSIIETIVEMIHGAQIAEAHRHAPLCKEKAHKHAKAAEESISHKGHKHGLAMVKYIYGDSDEPVVPRGRRRKWSEWEI